MRTRILTVLSLLLLLVATLCTQADAGVTSVATPSPALDEPETFKVTNAPDATTTVLNIVGLPEADARYYITSVALTIGTVSKAYHATITAGSIISQTLAPGNVVAVGSSVDLVVSLGPAPVNVPNIVGLTQTAAALAVTTAGLTVGDITLTNSNNVPAGSVISQNPLAGASTTPGSGVYLTVSLGPLPTGNIGLPSSLLSDAYTAVSTEATIKTRNITFVGNLECTLDKSVQIKGGYDEGFTANAGYTVLNGIITIRNGTLRVEKITVRPIIPVITVPGAPTNVKVAAGTAVGTTASISFTAPDSNGGSDITGYTVTVTPGGFTATELASPIAVTGLTAGTAYTFSVVASNIRGSSAASAVNNINSYDIIETFLEPDTAPRNSIFIGSFTYDSISQTVVNLHGILSESMTGTFPYRAYPNDDMTWLTLNYQLSSVYDATLDGLLITTFRNNSTNTLSTDPAFNGTDGWAPGSGTGLYYGFPGPNPGNAYARIFVNSTDPTAALTQAQIDNLAYADCAPGGMMGAATCMTGTTVAGYGFVGTMGGYPVSQVITKQ